MEPADEVDVSGAEGAPIVLPIKNGPATGYAWHLELPPGVVRIEDSPGSPPDRSESLGGSAGGFLRVTAPRGEHVVVARLARPWERQAPVKTVRVRLRVG
jgi:predicted secreted protein